VAWQRNNSEAESRASELSKDAAYRSGKSDWVKAKCVSIGAQNRPTIGAQ
jgi:hypothetical protein